MTTAERRVLRAALRLAAAANRYREMIDADTGTVKQHNDANDAYRRAQQAVIDAVTPAKAGWTVALSWGYYRGFKIVRTDHSVMVYCWRFALTILGGIQLGIERRK